MCCSDTGMAVHKECLEKAKDMSGIFLSAVLNQITWYVILIEIIYFKMLATCLYCYSLYLIVFRFCFWC